MEEFFIFEKNDQNFGVPVKSVLEIVEMDEIQDLNLELFGCIGGMAHRNNLVPIFDSNTLGTKSEAKVSNLTTVIIVLCGDIIFGLTMDQYIGVDQLSTRSKNDEDNNGVRENKNISAIVGYQRSTLILFSIDYISQQVFQSIDEQKFYSEQGELEAEKLQSNLRRGPFKQFLCISIENFVLAIQIDQIREVIEAYEVTPVFKVPELLRGLINLRGNVIACIDISREIGLDLRPLNLTTKFIIISYGDSSIALCADAVHGMKNLYLQEIQKPDAVLNERQQVFVEGIYEEVNSTLLLLSIPEIFNSEHLTEFTDMGNNIR